MATQKLQILAWNNWLEQPAQPLLIAGPCSAESEEQVLQTAHALKTSGRTAAFRAGVWKPRTRPGSFEGIGSPALKWLQRVKTETGLPVITEVANAHHVEAVLEHGLDAVWIGARTTVNPFYVQEIAEALRGVDIPVLVKNPLHPDVGLWVGALERFNRLGITRMAAVHRGFYSHASAPFRNEPKWEMSIELRSLAPNLPILCDPSHIAGRRDLLGEVCQTALDINLDGLMIEVHPHPDRALSDPEQQLSPAQLDALLSRLVIRSVESDDHLFNRQLEELRDQIDLVDHALIEQLARRFNIVGHIGQVKKENDVTIFQIRRWFNILKDRKARGQEHGLDEAFIHELFQLIHKYSIRVQSQVMHQGEEIPGNEP